MADNVTITPGAGASVRTVDNGSGFQKQVMVLDVGGESAESLIATGSGALPVTAPTVITSVSVTRPANTTAYAAGQIVNHATSSDAPWSFASATRVAAGSGTIMNAKLVDNVNSTAPGYFELYLFKSSPVNTANSATGPNDAQVLGLTSADANALVAVIPFGTSYLTSAAASTAGQRVFMATNLNMGFAIASGSTLFGLLVVRTAYTPISAEAFECELTIAQN